MGKLIPITILTGFLGSGKTTFLNKILKANKKYKIAIVLNEFGDIKLETQLIERQNEGIMELSNGCVCCVAREDMISTLNKIIKEYPETQYIIIEASGLSDPFSLSLTIYNPSLSDKFRLDSIVCLVDYLNFEEELDNYDIARKQISDANIIIVSKLNTKNKEEYERLLELINSLNKKCQIYIDSNQFNPLEILDRSLTDFDSVEDLDHSHFHEEFEHYIFQTDKSIDYEDFNSFIEKLDKNIIRVKGFINFANSPHKNKKYLLQYVIGRKDYKIVDWNEKNKTAILFVGKNINVQYIEHSLNKMSL